MVAKRWGVWLLCLGGLGCWGGEPRSLGPSVVAEPAPAAAPARPDAHEGALALAGVLSDADLAAVAAGGPEVVAEPAKVGQMPLPQGAVLALETTALDAGDDLAISFGDTRGEALRSALDAGMLGDPLPAPSVPDLPAVPAAPAPDL